MIATPKTSRQDDPKVVRAVTHLQFPPVALRDRQRLCPLSLFAIVSGFIFLKIELRDWIWCDTVATESSADSRLYLIQAAVFTTVIIPLGIE